MRFLAVFLCLLGCSTVGPSTTWDPHLESLAVNSRSFKAGRTPEAVVMVRAMASRGGGREAYALGIIVARSDLNYPKITALKSFGRDLPYERQDRHRIGRLRAEVGIIPMTRARFRALAATGLTFRLYGKRGVYDAEVPARLFREVVLP